MYDWLRTSHVEYPPEPKDNGLQGFPKGCAEQGQNMEIRKQLILGIVPFELIREKSLLILGNREIDSNFRYAGQKGLSGEAFQQFPTQRTHSQE